MNPTNLTNLTNLTKQLLDLPWSWRLTQHAQDDLTWYELTIEELPGYLVAGRTEEEIRAEQRGVLRAFLETRLEHNDPIPLPSLTWRSSLFLLEEENREDREEPIRDRLRLLPI